MGAPDPTTLRLICEDYESDRKEREAEDDWFRAGGLTFEQACGRAAGSLMPNGGVHSHQKRPGRAVMSNFAKALVGHAQNLQEAETFETLLGRVEALARTVHGAGELAAYDVADRIGLHIGLAPQHVHLHAGTRSGAQALGLAAGRRVQSIRVSDLPRPLDQLIARDAENVLCIYADLFLTSSDRCTEALAERWVRRCGARTRSGC